MSVQMHVANVLINAMKLYLTMRESQRELAAAFNEAATRFGTDDELLSENLEMLSRARQTLERPAPRLSSIPTTMDTIVRKCSKMVAKLSKV